MAKRSKPDQPQAASAPPQAAPAPQGPTAATLEEAMTKAAADAQAEGITDPEEIRTRMLEARKRLTQG